MVVKYVRGLEYMVWGPIKNILQPPINDDLDDIVRVSNNHSNAFKTKKVPHKNIILHYLDSIV